jgi:hypothetical protein
MGFLLISGSITAARRIKQAPYRGIIKLKTKFIPAGRGIMPNLTDPAVFSAFIGIGGIVVIEIIHHVSDKFHRKADSLDRFFYEVYPKRLDVYKDVINTLEAMIESGESLMKPSLLTKEAARDRISQDKHLLMDLLTRIRMFGSGRTIILLADPAFKTNSDALADIYKAGNYCGVILGRWIKFVNDTLQDFIQAVREDAGSNFVDKTIQFYFSKTKGCLIKRIKNKLFPSKTDRIMKRIDNLGEQIEDNLRRDKDKPKDSDG